MSESPPLAAVAELRVRYAETDQMGVVYHANYLAWCEVGRTEFIRARGLSYAELERAGTGLAVMDATLRFHAPARYDDVIRITTTLAELKSRTLRFDYLIEQAETGTRLVTASTTLVGLGPDGRVVALPTQLRALLEAR
ncbi:MAG: acyl-CoA thioesterase [Gemmatimonadaceae bacterium]|nr:acyl-CoA thioesterase [Gemmatimonadaceae bacterium]